jgi:hypothetical protein
MVTMIFDAHDNEWLKIVASTCLGLVAGLIAEQLKSSMTGRRTRREVSNAIKNDLQFVQVLLPLCRLNTCDAKQVSSSIRLPAYEYYWQINKPAFYESTHLQFLGRQCEFIISDLRKIDAGLCTKLEGIKTIEEAISAALKSREMHFFEKLRSKYRRRRFQRRYKDQGPPFYYLDGKVIPKEKVVYVDNDGNPIPEGEGK